MALRPVTKLRSKDSDTIENAPLVVDQRKQSDQRYRLQVDRQTKRSFTTLEAAAEAGVTIKKAHPIVQVSIYDSVDCVNTIVGPEGLVEANAGA
jgi:adenylyl- and sulfurtransferase ThiI